MGLFKGADEIGGPAQTTFGEVALSEMVRPGAGEDGVNGALIV
ncbi:hypothetical protein [Bradyrhizobium quebecense]|nr:hypothetical protein [Bradyrhizobium quebecense]